MADETPKTSSATFNAFEGLLNTSPDDNKLGKADVQKAIDSAKELEGEQNRTYKKHLQEKILKYQEKLTQSKMDDERQQTKNNLTVLSTVLDKSIKDDARFFERQTGYEAPDKAAQAIDDMTQGAVKLQQDYWPVRYGTLILSGLGIMWIINKIRKKWFASKAEYAYDKEGNKTKIGYKKVRGLGRKAFGWGGMLAAIGGILGVSYLYNNSGEKKKEETPKTPDTPATDNSEESKDPNVEGYNWHDTYLLTLPAPKAGRVWQLTAVGESKVEKIITGNSIDLRNVNNIDMSSASSVTVRSVLEKPTSADLKPSNAKKIQKPSSGPSA